MIEATKAYKHENCRDAAIYVAMITEQTQESVSCVVHWINAVSQSHYIMGQEEITIKREDLPKWKPFEVRFR